MPRSDLSNTTILEYLLKNNNAFGLTTVEPMYGEMDNAFVGGAMELNLYPMQEKGLELIVPGESRFGGVVVRYPLAFLFFTGI
ncbi:MAG: hypothetical protein WAU91_08955 [Desulfatitalea sp.]